MNLGWFDGGHGGLRAANTDRDEVRRLLRIALDEGHLDPAEHDRRADAGATRRPAAIWGSWWRTCGATRGG